MSLEKNVFGLLFPILYGFGLEAQDQFVVLVGFEVFGEKLGIALEPLASAIQIQ